MNIFLLRQIFLNVDIFILCLKGIFDVAQCQLTTTKEEKSTYREQEMVSCNIKDSDSLTRLLDLTTAFVVLS